MHYVGTVVKTKFKSKCFYRFLLTIFLNSGFFFHLKNTLLTIIYYYKFASLSKVALGPSKNIRTLKFVLCRTMNNLSTLCSVLSLFQILVTFEIVIPYVITDRINIVSFAMAVFFQPFFKSRNLWNIIERSAEARYSKMLIWGFSGNPVAEPLCHRFLTGVHGHPRSPWRGFRGSEKITRAKFSIYLNLF